MTLLTHRQNDEYGQSLTKRIVAYKQLFEGRLHVKMVELINNSAEKGDVLGDENYHKHIERIIGRVTIRGRHGGDRKSGRFKNQQL